MDIDNVVVLNGRVITANIETNETLPTTNLTPGRVVYLTQIDLGNTPGLYVYTTLGWEVITNSGYVTGITAGYGLMGGGNGGTVTIDVDNTEIATIAITDDLNLNKLAITGGTLTGELDMGGNVISNVTTPSNAGDATNKDYVDNLLVGGINNKLDKSGDTMSGTLDMDDNLISNVGMPLTSKDASNKDYVDVEVANKNIGVGSLVANNPGLIISNTSSDYTINIDYTEVTAVAVTNNLNTIKLNKSGGTMSGTLDMNGNVITNTPTPSNNSDVTNKSYVDGSINNVTPSLYDVSITDGDSVYLIAMDGSNTGYRASKANINISSFNDDLGVWHAGNVGSGSGLDADTVDTIHASSFVRNDSVTSMSVDIDMGTNFIQNLGAPTNPNHAATKGYTDNQLISLSNLKMDKAGGTFAGPVYSSTSPTDPTELTNKSYVDSVVSGGGGIGTFADGSAATPGITFTNDLDTGLYRYGTDVLGISVGGTHVARFTNLVFTVESPQGIRNTSGTPSVPTYSFIDDNHTGMYLKSSHNLAFTTNNVERMAIDDTSITSQLPHSIETNLDDHLQLHDSLDDSINIRFEGVSGDEQSVILQYEASDGNLLESGYALRVISGGSPAQVGIKAHFEVEGNIYSDGSRVLTTADEGSGSGLDADTLDGQHGSFYQNAGNLVSGIILSSRFDDSSHGSRSGGSLHSVATQSTHGFFSNIDKTKIDGIQPNAEVNQYAFSYISVLGQNTVEADVKTDSVEFVGGTGVIITTNNVTDTITFALDSTTVRTTGNQTVAGKKTFSDAPSMGNNRITDVAAPSSVTDVANKSYVDGAIIGASEQYRTDTSSATLIESDVCFADTSGGGFTLTLPSSPSIGDQITILDAASTFDSNTLTVSRNGSNIMGLAENMTVTVKNACVTLIYSGNSTHGWRVRY